MVLQTGGDPAATIKCKLSTISYTAKYESDYGGMCVSCYNEKDEAALQEDPDQVCGGDVQTRSITLTPGVETAMVSIPILANDGYSSARFFLVRLEPSEDVECYISETIVRILNVHTFPNNLPPASQLGEKTTTLSSKTNWSLIYNFLVEAHRGNRKGVMKYTLVQLLKACISGLAMPTMRVSTHGLPRASMALPSPPYHTCSIDRVRDPLTGCARSATLCLRRQS